MPISPHYVQGAGGMATPAASTTIPYPSTTASGLIDFTQFNLGSLQLTPGQLDTRIWTSGSGISPRVKPGYTGAFVILYNDSDSYLNVTWTNTSIGDICPPHHERPIPIPVDEKSFTWSIQYQNSIANPACQQQLTCLFVDQVAIASGFVLREGPINPPIAAAAGLAPGTVPPGVIVPANQIFFGNTTGFGGMQVMDNPVVSGEFWLFTSSASPGTLSINRALGGLGELDLGPDGTFDIRDNLGHIGFQVDNSGNIHTISEVTLQGFGVPLSTQVPGLSTITVSGLTTVLTIIPAGNLNTMYRISGGLNVSNSGAATVTLQATYNDVRGVARTAFFQTYTGTALNAAALVTGDFPLEPLTIMRPATSANIVISYNDSTGAFTDRLQLYVERLL